MNNKLGPTVIGLTLLSQAAYAELKAGYFIDAPVTGMYYTTDSGLNGTTNKGAFRYQDGDVVTFYLGNDDKGMVLATISGQQVVTPLHATVTPSRAINMTRLLLSFDDTPQDRSEIMLATKVLSNPEVQKQLKSVNLEELDSYIEELPVELVTVKEAAKHLTESQAYIRDNFTSEDTVFDPLDKRLIEETVTRRGWRGNLCFFDLARLDEEGYQGPIGRLNYQLTKDGIYIYPSTGDYFGTDETNRLEASCNLNTSEAYTETIFEAVSNYEEWGGLLACAKDGCTRNDINGFDIDDYDDDGDWKYRSVAISYDSDIGLVMEKSQGLGKNEHIQHANRREFLKLTSDNPKIQEINMSGFWQVTEYNNLHSTQCLYISKGQVYTYTSNHDECSINTSKYERNVTEQFQDMWWLIQGNDIASLAQLNTPVKWYQDGHPRYTSWEYLPAGEQWDRGLLHRFSQAVSVDRHGIQQVETLNLLEFKKLASLEN